MSGYESETEDEDRQYNTIVTNKCTRENNLIANYNRERNETTPWKTVKANDDCIYETFETNDISAWRMATRNDLPSGGESYTFERAACIKMLKTNYLYKPVVEITPTSNLENRNKSNLHLPIGVSKASKIVTNKISETIVKPASHCNSINSSEQRMTGNVTNCNDTNTRKIKTDSKSNNTIIKSERNATTNDIQLCEIETNNRQTDNKLTNTLEDGKTRKLNLDQIERIKSDIIEPR